MILLWRETESQPIVSGIIIDHTLESLVPVICVKTLDELVIPYEVVFFELPEGEEDWALKIGAEVLITYSGGWTEPEPPHFEVDWR